MKPVAQADVNVDVVPKCERQFASNSRWARLQSWWRKRMRVSHPSCTTTSNLQQTVWVCIRSCAAFARRVLRRVPTTLTTTTTSVTQPVSKSIPRGDFNQTTLSVYFKRLSQSRSFPFLVFTVCLVHTLLALLLALHLPLTPHSSQSSFKPVHNVGPSSSSQYHQHHSGIRNNSLVANVKDVNTTLQFGSKPQPHRSETPRVRRFPEINVVVPQIVKGLRDGQSSSKSSESAQEIIRLHSPAKPLFSAYRRTSALLAQANRRHLIGNFPTDKRFLLYRAIGNDLPPRHGAGQVYSNVRFILDHEPRYPDLDRRWYVNRIVNESELARVLDLLVSKNETFVLDHFNTSAYSSVDFNFAVFEHPDILRSPTFSKRTSKTVRRLVTDVVFKTKNQYIVHNNQARNAMLDLGIGTGATYILPWDGNCYLTPTAWHNITTAIETTLHSAIVLNNSATNSTHPSVSPVSLRYFHVPMQRMTQSNDDLLNSSYVPTAAVEEPQLVFHREAVERFDESLPYGCGPKVDLLYRLRIPGIWTAKARDPHSCFGAANRALSVDVPGHDTILPAGWTARLFSGVHHLEVGGANRGFSRTSGVERISALATLSVARHSRGFSPRAPLIYSVDSLQNIATYYHHPHRKNSDPALIKSLLSATRAELASDDKLKRSFVSAAHDAAIHALAAIVASLPVSLHRSRQLVLACVARDTTPDVRLSGSVCSMLETARLLRLSGGFSSEDNELTRKWVFRRLDALERTKSAKKAYFETNADGVHFELMNACLAAYYGDFSRVVRATGLAKSRLRVQIGSRSLWTNGFDDAVDGLVAWATLAVIAERIGEDIWSFGSDTAYGGTPLLPTAIKSAVVEGLARPLINHQAVRTHHALQALACLTAHVATRSRVIHWPDDHAGSGRECSQTSVALIESGFALPPFWNLDLLPVDNLRS